MVTSLLLVAALLPSPSYRQRFPLPDATVPNGWGVNIHFTRPQLGEMEQMAAVGIKWVRMDFFWHHIEKEKGKYDFSGYDELMGHLERHKIRPLFILDYGNDNYEKGAPKSPEAQAAFVRFVKASVTRYKGRGVLWEMWNEPNLAMSWQPEPSVDLYSKLAVSVGKAIRETAPEEWYIGPATSGFDWGFLEGVFQKGVLRYFDAVSVHPYRQTSPETVAPDYARLRAIIDKHGPKGKSLPILSGEWGYSDIWQGQNPELKANYVVRQYLSNLASGVNLSIYYDWKNDGKDPKEPEHHFGLLMHDLSPKPASLQLAFVAKELKGFKYLTDLSQDLSPEPGDEARVLLFGRGEQRKLALWSQSGRTHSVRLPLNPVKAQVSGMGEVSEIDVNPGKGISVTGSVQILTPRKVDAWLKGLSLLPGKETVATAANEAETRQILGRWLTRVAQASQGRLTFLDGSGASAWVGSKALPALPKTAEGRLKAALSQVEAEFGMGEPMRFTATTRGDHSIQVSQSLTIIPSIPIRLQPGPTASSFYIENPTGWKGRLSCQAGQEKVSVDLTGSPSQPLSLPKVSRERLVLKRGSRVITAAPLLLAFPLWSSPPAFSIVTEGDVQGEVSVGLIDSSPGVFSLTSRFPAGWCYSLLQTSALPLLSTGPQDVISYGVEVYGDGSGNILRSRFVDSESQTFQPNGEPITWKGWKLVRFEVSTRDAGWWGGKGDGIIRYPVRLQNLLLVDSAKRLACETRIKFRNPHLIRRVQERKK